MFSPSVLFAILDAMETEADAEEENLLTVYTTVRKQAG